MGLWKSRQGDHYFCNVCSKRLDVTKSRPGYVPANWFVQQGRYTVTVCSVQCLHQIEGVNEIEGKEFEHETDSEEYTGNPT